MRLSECEQRLLADVECALTRVDPRHARQFTVLAPRRPRSWWRILPLPGRGRA